MHCAIDGICAGVQCNDMVSCSATVMRFTAASLGSAGAVCLFSVTAQQLHPMKHIKDTIRHRSQKY